MTPFQKLDSILLYIINGDYTTEETSLKQVDKVCIVVWSIVCSFLEKEKKQCFVEIM